MKKSEIIFRETKIITRQILLGFVDINREILPVFDKTNVYRIPFKHYDKFRQDDKERFSREMYRLTQEKFITKFYQDNETYLELTDKGKKRIKKYLTDQLEITTPKKWDKIWRMVIFDIPDDKKKARDVVRRKLERIGFIELQESVYVYPFNCLEEINFLKGVYYLSPHILYIEAKHIETEKNLIKIFLDTKVLKNSML